MSGQIIGGTAQYNEEDIYRKQMQIQQTIEDKLRKSEKTIGCDQCDSNTFELVYQFKEISALESPIGKSIKAPQQIFRCTSCRCIFDESRLTSV